MDERTNTEELKEELRRNIDEFMKLIAWVEQYSTSAQVILNSTQYLQDIIARVGAMSRGPAQPKYTAKLNCPHSNCGALLNVQLSSRGTSQLDCPYCQVAVTVQLS